MCRQTPPLIRVACSKSPERARISPCFNNPPPRATDGGQAGYKVPELFDLFAVFLRAAGLERIGLRHGNDVISGVDKVNLSGDACREIRQEIKPGAPQFLQSDATAERRMSLLECEHISRVRNAGAGKRAYRT